ncbi:hypothetical protein Dxin01_00084 [Deinococcus xinjiangensis]|uniref:Uncharacterized protein n=1 Tax=Deinococcus xinjiangensis TaxID=457454 RepID=A0ABP9VAS2_9DEIO
MKRLLLPKFAARVSLASEYERLLHQHTEMLTAMDTGLKSYENSRMFAHLDELDEAEARQVNFH